MKRALLILALLAGCSHGDDADPAHRLDLPASLTEVSGLAAASDDSVFAHNDETGVIYEISLEDGRILRAFGIGNPVLEDDFEGIAADGDRIWLITSEGVIRELAAGRDRTRVPYREYDTGVGNACEIEGLSLAPEPGSLLIACKRLLRGEPRATLFIYRWNAETHAPAGQPWREIDLGEALGRERAEFAPSGIEWVPALERILVIAARGRSMLVLDSEGHLLSRHRLDPERHPQSEGVTMVGTDRLVIADEGGGGIPGRIAVYPYPLTQARPR